MNFCSFLTDNIFRCPDLLEKNNIHVIEEYEAIPRVTRVTWGIWKPEKKLRTEIFWFNYISQWFSRDFQDHIRNILIKFVGCHAVFFFALPWTCTYSAQCEWRSQTIIPVWQGNRMKNTQLNYTWTFFHQYFTFLPDLVSSPHCFVYRNKEQEGKGINLFLCLISRIDSLHATI